MNKPCPTDIEISVCLACGATGRPVKESTLASLLKSTSRRQLTPGKDWRFCTTSTCNTVYYADGTEHSFKKGELSVRVGIKENDAPRQICYCFDHTVEEIEEQIRTTGKSTVLDNIKTRMHNGCWCETKNPMGSCCLATVKKEIQKAKEKYAVTAPLAHAHDQTACCRSQSENTGTGSTFLSDHTKTSAPQIIAWAGGLFSAAVASACCWLPLLLLTLGVSGAAVSAAFETLRPYFATLTIVLLGTAFYFAYRPRNSSTTDDLGLECCAPFHARHRLFGSFDRIIIWVATAASITVLFLPSYVGVFSRSEPVLIDQQDSNVLAVKIDGMTCEACETVAKAALAKIPGVIGIEVSFENRQAVVSADSSVDPELITNAITAVGYDVVGVQELKTLTPNDHSAPGQTD